MLEGRKIFIPGGTMGIGLGCAKKCIEYGAQVTLMSTREENLQKAKAKLGEKCHIFRGDATNPDDVNRGVAFAIEAMGGLDGAVNAVGHQHPSEIYGMKDEDFTFAIDMCLKSAMYCVRAESTYMIENKITGSIVNISSLNSTVAYTSYSGYCAAKAGLNMMGACACLELGRYGIRVNTVSPGFTDTAATHIILEYPPAVNDKVLQHMPLKRWSTTEEQGEAVAFLLSDRASYISGVNLIVDGGMQHTAYPDFFPVIGEVLSKK